MLIPVEPVVSRFQARSRTPRNLSYQPCLHTIHNLSRVRWQKRCSQTFDSFWSCRVRGPAPPSRRQTRDASQPAHLTSTRRAGKHCAFCLLLPRESASAEGIQCSRSTKNNARLQVCSVLREPHLFDVSLLAWDCAASTAAGDGTPILCTMRR